MRSAAPVVSPAPPSVSAGHRLSGSDPAPAVLGAPQTPASLHLCTAGFAPGSDGWRLINNFSVLTHIQVCFEIQQ